MSIRICRFVSMCVIVGGLVMIGSGCVSAPGTPRSVTLVKDGQPIATIVLAQEPTCAAALAAVELQEHIRKITGARVPIVTDDCTTSGVRILVGESAATRKLGLKSADFKSQEYLIGAYPDALVLMGRDKPDLLLTNSDVTVSGKPQTGEGQFKRMLQEPPLPDFYDDQATCYAVYDFLERFCNVRWFNPTDSGTICPQTKTLTVNVNTVRRAPAFATRVANMTYGDHEIRDTGIDTLWTRGTEGYKAWETAAYAQTHKRVPDDGRYGGPYALAKRRAIQLFMHRMRVGGEQNICGHSFYGYYDRFWRDGANKSKFFVEKRPDYFAKGYEGAGEPPQLCYTSRKVIEQVAADARAYYDTGEGTEVDRSIGAFRRLPNMFNLEPMDNDQFCKCPECRKWVNTDEEKSVFFSSGRHSDYWFNFVNEVTRELHKTHPDKNVITLAYWSHAAPPKRVKLDPSVAVEFCFACNRLPFDRPSYEHELKLLEAWGQEARIRPISLYLYYCFPMLNTAGGAQFHCFPGFFAHAIGEQFKLFHRYGYRGCYHDGYGQEVEAYLTYRLMDDPTLDVDRMLDEYFQKLYGAAASPMKQIYLTIEKTYCDPKSYPPEIATGKLEGHHHQNEEIAWKWLGTEERMKELGGLMEQARAAARTDMEKHQVELFDKGVWQYMLAGRAKYVAKQAEVISLKEAQKLPAKWKVKMDPANEGRTNKWFDAAFNDGSWKEASTLECLENQGYKDYRQAWYRAKALIPKECEGKKVVLYLGAVDETCWLWINGRFAGEFLYNPTLDSSSWENPLRFDITKFVNFGGENQITVLVQNLLGAGGIWKPSYILYKPKDWNPEGFKIISQP